METVALFTYGSGCTPKHSGSKPSTLSQPCLVNTSCSLANSTNARPLNSSLTNTIYKVTPDEDKLVTPNNTLGSIPRTGSPLQSPADLATSPAKANNGRDKCDTLYGTLRKELPPTLKAVPPPTIPPSSITPSQTPMLSTRTKKTVTICDSADIGRAVSPLSPERI